MQPLAMPFLPLMAVWRSVTSGGWSHAAQGPGSTSQAIKTQVKEQRS
jgi:hypothetical protein